MNIKDIASLNSTQYKKYHESLMSNNQGTSAVHVFFCIFFTVQCSIYSSILVKRISKYQYTYEYLIIVLPLILAHTVLADYIYVLNSIICILVLYELSFGFQQSNTPKQTFKSSRIASISIMRGLTYLITVLAILAVDFQSFPRVLAKTEQFGFSLMDTGVGLFVLMSGLVHKDLHNHTLIQILKSNIKFVSILLFLGIARYLSVKQLDYQEHVTEYGVHWNFFYTLAVCKFLSTILLYFTPDALLYSILTLFIHEFVLYIGLQEWVFSYIPRDNILSANREGVSSCLGYVSMYLFAAYVKKLLCGDSSYVMVKVFDFCFYVNTVSLKLVVGSFLMWFLLICFNFLRPASRTLANASYCIYLEAVLLTVVAILFFLETFQGDKNKLVVPKILEYGNTNGLSYFLIANLMTGAVNLSMRTLLVSKINTFLILNIYMITTLTIVGILKKNGIKI